MQPAHRSGVWCVGAIPSKGKKKDEEKDKEGYPAEKGKAKPKAPPKVAPVKGQGGFLGDWKLIIDPKRFIST